MTAVVERKSRGSQFVAYALIGIMLTAMGYGMGVWSAPVTSFGIDGSGNFHGNEVHVNDVVSEGDVHTSSLYVNSNKIYPQNSNSFTLWNDTLIYSRNEQTGAISSGANATTMIQSALTAGDDVYLKAGVYAVDSRIHLKTNNWLHGSGKGTKIISTCTDWRGTFESHAATPHKTGIHISDLWLHGGAGAERAIYLNWSDNYILENLYIDAFKVAISTGGGYGGKINNCAIENMSEKALFLGDIYASVNDCYITNIQQEAIRLEDGDLVVNNLIAYDTAKVGTPYSALFVGNGGLPISLTISNSVIDTTFIAFKSVGAPGAVYKFTANNLIVRNTTSTAFWDNSYVTSTMTNCDFNSTAADTLYVNGQLKISHSRINGFTHSGVYATSDMINSEVSDVAFTGNGGTDAIFEDGAGVRNNKYVDNQFISGCGTGILFVGGSGSTARGNTGYVTENSGTATLLNGQTTIAFNHGLSYTPDANDFSIIFTELPTNPTTGWTLGTFTSTQATFTANDPGASNLDFSWSAHKTP